MLAALLAPNQALAEANNGEKSARPQPAEELEEWVRG
jgi:hypothetical protein